MVRELENLLNNKEAVTGLAKSNPDVVVGGPPCQGFSLAGRRNQADKRNQLPWQFLEVVERTQPKLVVIENVVGMRHKFSSDQESAVFDQLQQALRETSPGYLVQPVEVNAVHYGAPQHRPRLMIIGLRLDIAAKKKITSTGKIWKSDFLDNLSAIPTLAPVPTTESNAARTVADAISDLPGNESGLKFVSDPRFRTIMGSSAWASLNAPGDIFNHKVRNHQPHAVERFRLYQVFAYAGIAPKVLSTASSMDEERAREYLLKQFKEIKFPISAPNKSLNIRTIDELVNHCIRAKTKKHSQKVLPWQSPSRTVVTIGDDYVHPFEPRTFTVRELARFQGFPDSFQFRAKETTGGVNRQVEVPQYSQVGNAVSPMLALAVGRMIKSVLGK